MPIHDWSRVESGTYHDFHQGWIIDTCRTLNRGTPPDGYFAILEAFARSDRPEPRPG